MFRIDEHSSAQNRVARRTMIYDVSDIQLENSVFLHPSIVSTEVVKNVRSEFFVYIS